MRDACQRAASAIRRDSADLGRPAASGRAGLQDHAIEPATRRGRSRRSPRPLLATDPRASRCCARATFDARGRAPEACAPSFRVISASRPRSRSRIAARVMRPRRLATGEVRRHIGSKLRAQGPVQRRLRDVTHRSDTGVYVSVKGDPGLDTDAECGANGYVNLPASAGAREPAGIEIGSNHTLRAELDGITLRVARRRRGRLGGAFRRRHSRSTARRACARTMQPSTSTCAYRTRARRLRA